MASNGKLTQLDQDDLDMRKAIVNNAGYLHDAAIELNWPLTRIYNKVRAKKHRLWWMNKKAHYKLERKRARERRWYHAAKNRAIDLELKKNSG